MTKKNLFYGLLALAFAFTLTSCGNDDDEGSSTESLSLNIQGLEDLGGDYVYEGWIMVDGSPVTTGTFQVNASGQLSQTEFDIDAADLAAATAFVLTIEPAVDPDPAPAATKILSGDFSGNTASVSINMMVGDFTNASGNYFLATPTDGNVNPLSGLWFIDASSGTPEAGLKDLPSLPAGWAYEGWVVINGTPLSTGVFTSAEGADQSSIYSGPMDGPPFPGEDFLMNAPAGLSFPTDLSGATVVVSVEPVPDNSPSPFTLKPLAGGVPNPAAGLTPYDVNFSSQSLPTGSVSR
ncbi:MAG: hypothetical protein AAF740_14240 [Bacteroidota bacterium]